MVCILYRCRKLFSEVPILDLIEITVKIIVGDAAKRQAVTNPDTVISNQILKWETSEKVSANGKEYTPQEISAMILQYLKGYAEDYLGEKSN